MSLSISEFFVSIQGESTFSGIPFAFVRLSGCNLSCAWCDTPYACEARAVMPVEEIVGKVLAFDLPHIMVTGGEPLVQNEAPNLVRELLDRQKTVVVETNGSLDIRVLDRRAVIVMDVKCPSSGESESNDLANLDRLADQDELKFVMAGRADFDFAAEIVRTLEKNGEARRPIHFSPVWGTLSPARLADWILATRLPVRLTLQEHKVIWGENARGR